MGSVGGRELSITRIARLEAIIKHLDDLKFTLPEDLVQFSGRDTILPTGVRECSVVSYSMLILKHLM